MPHGRLHLASFRSSPHRRRGTAGEAHGRPRASSTAPTFNKRGSVVDEKTTALPDRLHFSGTVDDTKKLYDELTKALERGYGALHGAGSSKASTQLDGTFSRNLSLSMSVHGPGAVRRARPAGRQRQRHGKDL